MISHAFLGGVLRNFPLGNEHVKQRNVFGQNRTDDLHVEHMNCTGEVLLLILAVMECPSEEDHAAFSTFLM